MSFTGVLCFCLGLSQNRSSWACHLTLLAWVPLHCTCIDNIIVHSVMIKVFKTYWNKTEDRIRNSAIPILEQAQKNTAQVNM